MSCPNGAGEGWVSTALAGEESQVVIKRSSTARSDRQPPPRATHTARSTMIRPGSCTAQDRHGDRAYESSSPSPVTRMVSVSSRASASAQDVSAGWHDG